MASIKEFGILLSLGSKTLLPLAIFSIQSVTLGFFGALLGWLLSTAVLPLLSYLLTPVVGEIAVSAISTSAVCVGFMMAIGGSLSISFPLLARLSTLKPSFLFQESQLPSLSFSWQHALWFAPALVFWWAAAVIQSHSFKIGCQFVLLFLSSAIVLALLGWLLLKVVSVLIRRIHIPWPLRLSLTQIARQPLASISCFLSLALGAALINLIPQIRNAISKEIERPDTVVPQFFLFDIQEDQLKDLQTFMTQNQLQLLTPSPLIRARLTEINGQAFDKRTVKFEDNVEQEQRENLQTRTQNLSYRETLSPSEVIVKGKYVGEAWNNEGVPAISVEEGFAKRMSLNIGDTMKFNVTGMDIEGKITSLRKVRWTSFQPNFFVVFQPGVLEEAPKIWVAAASGVADTRRDILQTKLVNQFPNVSVVDVKAATRRILVLVDQVSSVVRFIALLACITGLGVLFSIAQNQAATRRMSFALLKTFGVSVQNSIGVFLIEYGFVALSAAFFGVLLSLAMSWFLNIYILGLNWLPEWQLSMATLLILFPTAMVLAWFAVRKTAQVQVSELLR